MAKKTRNQEMGKVGNWMKKACKCPKKEQDDEYR